jgi:hypothetical protein
MARTLFDKLAPHLLRSLNDDQYMALDYLWHQRRFPRLRAPRTYSDKLLWLRTHYRDEFMRECADKYLVRDFVRKTVPADILVPLIGVYSTPRDLLAANLPDSFILKATHGSGWNIQCRSRASFDLEKAAATMAEFLHSSYYRLGREWVYKDIQPRILCETLLLDAAGEVPNDYKVQCFHGEPVFVQVDYSRHSAHARNLYDLDWRLLPCRKGRYPNNLAASAEPPEALPRMLEIARDLARPFPFVRVDLYALGQQVYFGELTFYPERGVSRFEPHEFDVYYGQYLDLDSIQEHVV